MSTAKLHTGVRTSGSRLECIKFPRGYPVRVAHPNIHNAKQLLIEMEKENSPSLLVSIFSFCIMSHLPI